MFVCGAWQQVGIWKQTGWVRFRIEARKVLIVFKILFSFSRIYLISFGFR